METQEKFTNLPQQAAYGSLLQILVNTSLLTIIATFAIYLGGFLEPLVGIEQLPEFWSLSLNEFIAATGSPTGWSWTAMIGKGDYINFIGIDLSLDYCHIARKRIDAISKEKK